MQVDHKEGQEMMKLGYLNNDEIKRMAGEPAQGHRQGQANQDKPRDEPVAACY